MNWSNVKLVTLREVRDQLRDRRTMFMIFVLPIMLYPFLGMSFAQVQQFIQEHPTKILFVGRDRLPDTPPLFDEPQASGDSEYVYFDLDLFRTDTDEPTEEELADPRFQEFQASSRKKAKQKQELLQVYESDQIEAFGDSAGQLLEARNAVQSGKYEVAVYVPPDFAEKLADFRRRLTDRSADKDELKIPEPVIYHHGAKEKSQLAFDRVYRVLTRWREEIGRRNLEAVGVSEQALAPFEQDTQDVANPGQSGAALWSKIFPFLLLIWALTGAFYPAIDLCAGEKERGTLETLLSSPAKRSEIVWGKLLTIMLFSIATVVLNLVSVVVTGLLLFSKIPGVGPPPLSAFVWLLLALVPVSALFAAICLALAAFARSTKEGQYYLMPAFMITLPLVLVTLSPGAEMNLGMSLIPITGIVMLLQSLIEGELLQAAKFVVPVVVVTGCCCLLALRWAIDQFNKESVLFRESERLDLGLWLRHLLRDRGETPSAAEAIFCGVLILLVGFVMQLVLVGQLDTFLKMAVVTQLVVVLTPAVLMTAMLTRSPRKTLLLHLPKWETLVAAALLPICLHPLVNLFKMAVIRLYPINPEIAEQLSGMMDVPLWKVLIAVAVLAPLCEEVAFRGFILSGLRHLGHKWQAILISSVFFALAHGSFQQTLIVFPVGLVLGYLAVQSGSLLPGIVFHTLHNSFAVLLAWLMSKGRVPEFLVESINAEGEYLVSWPLTILGTLAAAGLIWWLHRQPYDRTPEEALQEKIEQQAARSLAG